MTRKRIIVEGPDGSGKSTLILALFKAFPGQLEMREGFKHSDAPNYLDWIIKELFPTEDPTKVPIHNRLFYSELVYGPIIRGELAVTPNQSSALKSFLRHEAFLIYCNLPYADLVKSATELPQMEGVMDNLRTIYHGYDDLMATEMPYYWPQGRCTSYNFSRDTTKNVIQMVGDYLEHQ
jgi:hypothetical protein